MGVLTAPMQPQSPTGKRASTLTVGIIGAAVALLLLGVYAMAPGGAMGPPNRRRVRLNLDTSTGKASWEAEGDEQQVADALAAIGGSKSGGAQQQQQQLTAPGEEEVANAAAALEAAMDIKSQKRLEGQQQQQQQEGQQQQQDRMLQVDHVAEAAGRNFAAQTGRCDNVNWGQFNCLAMQADMALGTMDGKRQFRFPHFYIAGFQKCATTSLFHHLRSHPQLQPASKKEPEFFTQNCTYNSMRCRPSQQRAYLRDILMFKEAHEAGFTKAAYEGSTHYAYEGKWLAMQLMEFFPWLKIVMTMREPISQAIAMVNHNVVHDLVPECYNAEHNLVYECIIVDLDHESRYATSLKPWIKHMPRGQLHLIQYENLTSADNMVGSLRDMKSFLEIEPLLPSDKLGMKNFRHQRKNGNGWPMQRQQYEALVEKARRNTIEVVDLVRQHGFADADGWRANWEAAWKLNLDEHCEDGPEGLCMVQAM